jgi:hypothetical protein
VLLGSHHGFDPVRKIELPTDGATGSLVSDFNRDGYPDIFYFCHRADGSFDELGKFGDHHTNSLLYWGSSNGFKSENKLELPTVGVHYDMGIDLGHIRNRGYIYEYTSSSYFCGDRQPIHITWTGRTPRYTSLKFQLRSAESESELAAVSWMGPGGSESYYLKPGSKIENLNSGKWIQYKVIFDTDNGAYSPVLDMVEIQFR